MSSSALATLALLAGSHLARLASATEAGGTDTLCAPFTWPETSCPSDIAPTVISARWGGCSSASITATINSVTAPSILDGNCTSPDGLSQPINDYGKLVYSISVGSLGGTLSVDTCFPETNFAAAVLVSGSSAGRTDLGDPSGWRVEI